MRFRLPLATALALATLGCAGLFDDEVREGRAAVDRIGAVAGAPLPVVVDAGRSVDTTGIDWLFVGEAVGPRDALEPWFDALTLPCGQPTVEDASPGAPSFQRALGSGWAAPEGERWRIKRCEGATHSGPHHEAALTVDGDPAWVHVHAITL